MGKRRERSENQIAFVPHDEMQPEAFTSQANIHDQLFEPDMVRHFSLDWKQVKVGHKQWAYLIEQAEEILGRIRLMVDAVADTSGQAQRDRYALFEEMGLLESWQEYSNSLILLYRAYPQYLEWFAQRVDTEYQGMVQKWSDWLDSIVLEGEEYASEFWVFDCRVCAYEDFRNAVAWILPRLEEKEERCR